MEPRVSRASGLRKAGKLGTPDSGLGVDRGVELRFIIYQPNDHWQITDRLLVVTSCYASWGCWESY